MESSRHGQFKEVIRRVEDVCQEDPNIVGLLLTGSISRGIEDIHSDVDFFIFVRKGLDFQYEQKAKNFAQRLGELLLFYTLDHTNVAILQDLVEVDFTFCDIGEVEAGPRFLDSKILYDNSGGALQALVERSNLKVRWKSIEGINKLRATIRGKILNLSVAHLRGNPWEARNILNLVRDKITRLYASLAGLEMVSFKRIATIADDWYLEGLANTLETSSGQLGETTEKAFELLHEVEKNYNRPNLADYSKFDRVFRERLKRLNRGDAGGE